jgi:hypothetical protein
MQPKPKSDTVVPESFRIVLRQYLQHPEVKSLAPDGTMCTGDTVGLLRRASILAGDIVPIRKETDRHWEQGEDPSMADFEVWEYRKKRKMVVADISDRREWRKLGVRCCQRKSGLSINTVRNILDGKPVKLLTLKMFVQVMRG